MSGGMPRSAALCAHRCALLGPAAGPGGALSLDAEVEVRLTEAGKNAHRAAHDAFWAAVVEEQGIAIGAAARAYSAPQEDAGGWSRWPLRALFEHFGRGMGPGQPPLFEAHLRVPAAAAAAPPADRAAAQAMIRAGADWLREHDPGLR